MKQDYDWQAIMFKVDKYQDQIGWLRDSKFLQDLENDSVDSEILDEEFNALQEEETPISTREKVVKCLQSNPVQILLCVLVLLDAGIVIAQILLDLNSVRNRLSRREQDLLELLEYVKDGSALELDGYKGNDVSYILQILRDHRDWKMQSQENKLQTWKNTSDSPDHRRRKKSTVTDERSSNNDNERPEMGDKSPFTAGVDSRQADGRTEPGVDKQSGDYQPTGTDTAVNIDMQNGNDSKNDTSAGRVDLNSSCIVQCMQQKDVFHVNSNDHFHHVVHDEHDALHEVAHGLHFASIAILGFLVVEDLVKIIAMGREFFHHKIEIFDAVIIAGSFAFDIVFLGGVSGQEGQKAAAVLVVLLLWRIARVADGIVITVKQRQELRIRLQKRARRKAEKRMDALEEERHNRIRQIMALKELCLEAGVKQQDIDACTPQPPPRRMSTTMNALSSIARLSFSMTMSMSSGLFSMAEEENNEEVTTPRPTPRRLSWGGPGENDRAPSRGSGGLLWRLTRRSGQLAIPPPIPSSILEKYKTRVGDNDIELAMRDYQRSPSPPASPPNSCGIQIVIDQGTDSPSSEDEAADDDTTNTPDTPDSDSYLNVDYLTDSRRSSSSSGSSRVYLLKGMR